MTDRLERSAAMGRVQYDDVSHYETLYRTLFNAMDEGFVLTEVVFEGDRPVDLICLDANPAAQRLAGTRLIGQRWSELAGREEPDELRIWGRVARSGESQRFVRSAPGSDTWLDFHVFRIDDHGRLRVAAVFDDITERKRAEELLRESSERKAFLLALTDRGRALHDETEIMGVLGEMLARELDVSAVGYAEVDADARTGVTSGGHHATPSLLRLGERFRFSDYGGEMFDTLLTGRSLFIEDFGREGSRRPEHLAKVRELQVAAGAAVPLMRNARLVAYGFATHPTARAWRPRDRKLLQEAAERTWIEVERARSEAARARAEAALREADQRKNDFIAVLAHELRNPLAAIKVGIELLDTPQIKEATRAVTLPLVARQIEHTERLIDDLIDINRIVQDKVQLRLSATTLQRCVGDALDMMRAHARERGIALRVQQPDQGIPLLADHVRITQICVNIISNALKYSGDARDVEIYLERDETEARLRVIDFGIGIAPDVLPRIFDPFVQVDCRQADDMGLGLGLSVVRRLVTLHGGRVEAFSAGLELGSELVVHLPLAAS